MNICHIIITCCQKLSLPGDKDPNKKIVADTSKLIGKYSTIITKS